MARSAANDRPRNDRDSLALWASQRQSAIADYRRVLNERENDLLGLGEELGPRSTKQQTARRRLHDAEMQFHQIQQVLRRPLQKHGVRYWLFALFAIALALLEAPVNKYLFDVALQGSSFVSYSVSIAVAAFLLIVAHLAGRALRQVWSEYRRRVIWSNALIFAASLAVIFTVIGILTVGRAQTSAEAVMNGFGGIFSAVGTQIGTLGIFGALLAAFGDIHALILATVNLGGVFVAFLLAYFSHDPDKDFDASAVALEKCRTAVDKLQAEYQKRRKKIIARIKPDLTAISASHGAANRSVFELKTRLGIPLDDDDRLVIDEFDRLAEDSEHADEAGVVEDRPEPPSDGSVRTFARKAS